MNLKFNFCCPQYDPKRSEERMKKREIKLRAIESNGFDGEVPLKPLTAV